MNEQLNEIAGFVCFVAYSLSLSPFRTVGILKITWYLAMSTCRLNVIRVKDVENKALPISVRRGDYLRADYLRAVDVGLVTGLRRAVPYL